MKAGVYVGHAWGMTETSPIGTMGKRPWNWDELGFEDRVDIICRQGCPPFGVELRIVDDQDHVLPRDGVTSGRLQCRGPWVLQRSEEHTSELQSLMRISYAVFCLKKKKKTEHTHTCTERK